MGYLTNFPNGVSSSGVPTIGSGLPATFGTYYFVNPDTGNDLHDGLSKDAPFATVAKAYASVTTNKDDVIVLSTNSVHTISTQLNITKSRVHFVGDVFGRVYGQRARLYQGVTAETVDIHMVKNVGVGNTFTGIKFWSDNSNSDSTSVVGEGGEYTVYRNCEFYSSVKLDSDTYAEVLLNGDSTQFYDCTFGSLAAVVSGNKVRPAVITTLGGVAGGAGTSRDVLFDRCRFWKKAGGTTTAFVKILADAEIERVMEFHDCQFVANILGATPAVAIASAASLTVGQVLLTGDTCGFDVTKLATATGIISCLNLKVATGTIGLQAT